MLGTLIPLKRIKALEFDTVMYTRLLHNWKRFKQPKGQSTDAYNTNQNLNNLFQRSSQKSTQANTNAARTMTITKNLILNFVKLYAAPFQINTDLALASSWFRLVFNQRFGYLLFLPKQFKFFFFLNARTLTTQSSNNYLQYCKPARYAIFLYTHLPLPLDKDSSFIKACTLNDQQQY